MALLDRRQVLLSTLALAAAGPRALAGEAGSADPLALGAKGDGRSDDTAALVRALTSGRPVDGGGRTYGVSGWLRAGPSFRGLTNCVLRQLQPGANRTLYVERAEGFRIADVAIVRAAGGDDGFVQRDMMENAGLWLQGCSGFRLERIGVRGGGIGTGLVIDEGSRFTVTDAEVAGIRYRRRERPSDDMIQGMWINRSRDFELVKVRIRDLGGEDSLGFSRDNNRAVAIGGCSRFNVRDLHVSDCGQGLDITGTEGNREFQVIGGRAQDCWTWGFKFANSAQFGKVTGAVAERCGLGGFVVSGRSEPEVNPPPHSIEVRDSVALDCGRPDDDRTMFGFGVLRARPDPVYPRKVAFVRCSAIDRRVRRGMKWGFFNEIQAPPAERNRVEDCRVRGAVVADFYGFR